MIYKIKYFIATVAFYFISPLAVLGAEREDLLVNAGRRAGFDVEGGASISVIVGRIIYASLGLLGVIFLVLIVYAGYLYLTAGGEEQKVEEAKKYIKNGVIGLIIVLAAFGITRFVMGSLLNATLPQQ